jgi:2,3-dihydroxy-2,3-dihydrophenylpropionate dehydrogenase
MNESRRTVLVTGGASGIGLAVCAAFAAGGDRVVSLDLRESAAAHESVVGDVTVAADHDRAVAAAGESLGVLVVNAGVHDGGVGLSLDGDELAAITRRVLDVDVLGYVLAVRAAAPMLAASGGCIILTLSDAAFLVGQQGAGIAYTAAKHAGLGILGWAAHALAPHVRVNAIAPGGVITSLAAVDAAGAGRPLFADADAKRDTIRSRNPLKTILEPDELAQLYVWLASPAARTLTGEIVRPDGGLGVR